MTPGYPPPLTAPVRPPPPTRCQPSRAVHVFLAIAAARRAPRHRPPTRKVSAPGHGPPDASCSERRTVAVHSRLTAVGWPKRHSAAHRTALFDPEGAPPPRQHPRPYRRHPKTARAERRAPPPTRRQPTADELAVAATRPPRCGSVLAADSRDGGRGCRPERDPWLRQTSLSGRPPPPNAAVDAALASSGLAAAGRPQRDALHPPTRRTPLAVPRHPLSHPSAPANCRWP